LSRTDAAGWRRTSPLAVLFFFGKILAGLAKNATQVIAPMAAFFVAFPGNTQTKIALAAAGFVIITTTSSVLRYWFFRFQIGEDAILVREGVVNKKQLDIKFKRIQGINTEQSFVNRWFDLVTISFDTAGSAGSEAELPAVETELATALRERIGKVSKDLPDSEHDKPAAENAPLLRLDWRDMIRIGLADRRAFVFLAVIAPFFEQISEEFGQAIANQIEDVAADVAAMGPAIAATVLGTVVLIVVAMLVIGSIVAAFLRYHNFALYLDGSRLRSVGGLLTRHEATMETGKVQVARVSQGLVLRWSKRVRIVLKQASSKAQRTSKSFLVPAAPTGFQQSFLGDVLAPEASALELDFDSDSLERVDVRFVRPRILYGALLPVLALAPLVWMGAGPLVIAILFWVPLWSLIQWQMWRRLAWYVDADSLIRRKGLIGKQLDVFLLRKVQRVTLTQSRYQRRKALATLTFYLASGRIKLPYMPLSRAEIVRDYVLYKVESSTRPWH
jgi:putative membrane protein